MLAEKGAVSMSQYRDSRTRGYTTCSRASSSLLRQYPFPFEFSDDAFVNEILGLQLAKFRIDAASEFALYYEFRQ